jgi:hypothetical protein
MNNPRFLPFNKIEFLGMSTNVGDSKCNLQGCININNRESSAPITATSFRLTFSDNRFWKVAMVALLRE